MNSTVLDSQALRETLLSRAKTAKKKLGPTWKKQIIEADPFFDSQEGSNYLWQFQSATGPKGSTVRISLDRIHRIAKALETAAGIPYEPITI